MCVSFGWKLYAGCGTEEEGSAAWLHAVRQTHIGFSEPASHSCFKRRCITYSRGQIALLLFSSVSSLETHRLSTNSGKTPHSFNYGDCNIYTALRLLTVEEFWKLSKESGDLLLPIYPNSDLTDMLLLWDVVGHYPRDVKYIADNCFLVCFVITLIARRFRSSILARARHLFQADCNRLKMLLQFLRNVQ